MRTLLHLLTTFESQRGESPLVQRFRDFAESDPNVFLRSHSPGHFTASSWLVDRSGKHALLTQHRKLGRWLQLGGHADGDADLCAVALKEALEESGLPALRIEPDVFDLDVHTIPARGAEPEHLHWDVRFVVRCTGSEQFSLSDESLALAWVDIAEIAASADPRFDASLVRMARRWRSFSEADSR